MHKIGKINNYSPGKFNFFRWHFNPSWERAVIEHVKDWAMAHEYVYDADQCGDGNYFYVVGNEGVFTFFKVSHSWYWEDEDGDRYLENTFDCEETTREEIEKAGYPIPPLV